MLVSPQGEEAMQTILMRDVMTRTPTAVAPEDALAEARHQMVAHGVRHLPVCEGTRIVGVVSQRDLYYTEGHRDEAREVVRVADAMTAFPYVVDASAPLEEVARSMADSK